MPDPSSTISSTTEQCDNCGHKPAVRAFIGGRAANWFLCGRCDPLVATQFQCMGCGSLHRTLMAAVDHVKAVSDEQRSTAAERYKHPKRNDTVIRFPSPANLVGPQMIAGGQW